MGDVKGTTRIVAGDVKSEVAYIDEKGSDVSGGRLAESLTR